MEYPFLKILEENWKDVLEELDNLLYDEVASGKPYFSPWHETDIYDGGLVSMRLEKS